MATSKGEWWLHEEGGYLCSNCGCYYDDYYTGYPPIKCEQCGSKNKINYDYEVDRKDRLSKNLRYVDENDYPEWLNEYRRRVNMKGGAEKCCK